MQAQIIESLKATGFIVRPSKSTKKQSVFVELMVGSVSKNQVELTIAEVEQHALTLPENYKSPKASQRASHCVEVIF